MVDIAQVEKFLPHEPAFDRRQPPVRQKASNARKWFEFPATAIPLTDIVSSSLELLAKLEEPQTDRRTEIEALYGYICVYLSVRVCVGLA